MNETGRSVLLVVAVLAGALSVAAWLIWFERRLLAGFQDRYGPNRVGPFGLLQVLADTIKIFTKEDWTPPSPTRASSCWPPPWRWSAC